MLPSRPITHICTHPVLLWFSSQVWCLFRNGYLGDPQRWEKGEIPPAQWPRAHNEAKAVADPPWRESVSLGPSCPPCPCRWPEGAEGREEAWAAPSSLASWRNVSKCTSCFRATRTIFSDPCGDKQRPTTGEKQRLSIQNLLEQGSHPTSFAVWRKLTGRGVGKLSDGRKGGFQVGSDGGLWAWRSWRWPIGSGVSYGIG